MRIRHLFTAVLFFCVASAEAEWNKGLEAYKRKNWSAAVKEFEEVTRTNPDYAGAYYMLGVSQRAAGILGPAIRSLGRAVELDGSQASYKIALGQALLQADQYQNAYELLKPLSMSSMEASHRSSYALLFAQAATKTDRPDEAIGVLSTQARADSGNYRLQQALGSAYTSSGDEAKAFEAYKKAFELNPRDATSARNAVKAAISVARRSNSTSTKNSYYTQAGQIADRLAYGSPTFEHQLLAGEAWLGAEEYSEAINWFGLAIGSQPSNPLAHYYAAVCHTSLSDFDSALEELTIAEDLGAIGKLGDQIEGLRQYVKKETGQPPAEGPLPECPGFRDATWGMNRSQVVAIEGEPNLNNEKTLGYSGEVAGKSTYIFYEFVDDQLARGSYIFSEEHVFKNKYIDDFNSLKGLLTTKYGNPKTDAVNWNNDLYRDDPGEWGTAVSIGHLGFMAEWVTDKTDIMLVLGGGDFTATLMITYVSRELTEKLDNATTEDQLSDL